MHAYHHTFSLTSMHTSMHKIVNVSTSPHAIKPVMAHQPYTLYTLYRVVYYILYTLFYIPYPIYLYHTTIEYMIVYLYRVLLTIYYLLLYGYQLRLSNHLLYHFNKPLNEPNTLYRVIFVMSDCPIHLFPGWDLPPFGSELG